MSAILVAAVTAAAISSTSSGGGSVELSPNGAIVFLIGALMTFQVLPWLLIDSARGYRSPEWITTASVTTSLIGCIVMLLSPLF